MQPAPNQARQYPLGHPGNPDPLARLQARKAQLQEELAKIEQLIDKLTSDPEALEIAKQMASVRI